MAETALEAANNVAKYLNCMIDPIIYQANE